VQGATDFVDLEDVRIGVDPVQRLERVGVALDDGLPGLAAIDAQARADQHLGAILLGDTDQHLLISENDPALGLVRDVVPINSNPPAGDAHEHLQSALTDTARRWIWKWHDIPACLVPKGLGPDRVRVRAQKSNERNLLRQDGGAWQTSGWEGWEGWGGGVNIHYAALAQLDSLGGDTHNNGALALDEVGNGVAHHRLRDRPRADLARGHARERVHRRHADSGLLARPSADLEEAPHAVTVLTIAGQHQVVLQVPPQLAVVPPERVGADVDRAEQPFAIRQGACTKIRW
jgi:hypothetical protein